MMEKVLFSPKMKLKELNFYNKLKHLSQGAFSIVLKEEPYNMKKKILAVLAAAVSFGVIFTGCAGSIKSGTVTDKEYNPAYTSNKF